MAALMSANCSTVWSAPKRAGNGSHGHRCQRFCVRGSIASAPNADAGQPGRRQTLAGLAAAAAAAAVCLAPAAQPPAAAAASDFVETESGLLVQDISIGQGRQPQPGDTCVVHWAGYTKNYQAKRIENTSLRDEPFEFVLGANSVIPAFEEAVAGMRVGGLRRVEVLGELPQLSYPRDRKERFVSGFKYRYGPQPSELGGQRALDFILDNPTLSATNRTLLLDIKLLAVRPAQR